MTESTPPTPSPAENSRLHHWRWLDAVYLLVLTAYLFGGLRLIPLHGDETSFIWASQDWAHLVLEPDLDRVRYDPARTDPVDVELQNERLATGPLHHYAIGLAWMLAGYTAEDIPPTDWNWDYTWDQNDAAGLIPPSGMLIAARAASTVGLALGLLGVFWLGRTLQGRGLAYPAALLYVINPILLLNGRRAMSEGMLIGMTMLALAAAAQYLSVSPLIPRPLPPRRGEGETNSAGEIRWLVVIGVLCGLAFSVKHNGALVGIIVGGVIAVVTLIRTRSLIGAVWRVALIGGAALLISFALAPAYWFDPAGAARAAWGMRDFITGAHAWTWGGYESAGERIGPLYRILFDPTPQYFDVPPWAAYLAETIWAYRGSPFSGISLPPVILGALAVIGLAALIVRVTSPPDPLSDFREGGTGSHRRRVGDVLVLVWMVISIGFTYWLIRLEWQRYYVPLVPVAVLLQGMGAAWLIGHAARLWQSVHGQTAMRASHGSAPTDNRRVLLSLGLAAVIAASLLLVRARIVERVKRPTRVMHFDVERGSFRPRAVNWRFDNGLWLRHMEVTPENPHSGEVAYIRLVWELTGAPVSDEYATIVEMVNWDRLTVAQVDSGYDIPFQTSSWIPGTVIEERLALEIPPGTPPGGYLLNIRLFAPRSNTVLQPSHLPIQGREGLRLIQVREPARPPTFAQMGIDNPMDAPAGFGFRLVEANFTPTSNEVGQPFILNLVWQRDEFDPAFFDLEPTYVFSLLWLNAAGQTHAESRTIDLVDGFNMVVGHQGDVWRTVHLLNVPAGLDDGQYQIAVQVREFSGAPTPASVEIGTMTVGVPERIFDLPHAQYDSTLEWDNDITLIGYDLPADSPSPLSLAFYWQTKTEITQYLTRFVHLIDAAGNIVAQNDSVPQGGARPTTGWIPGEVITETITLDAPPGDYQVRVGWYDARTGERVSLLELWGGGDFAILPTGVTITN